MTGKLLIGWCVVVGLVAWSVCGTGSAQGSTLVADSFLSGVNPAAGEYAPGDLVPQNPVVSTYNAAWADGLTTSVTGTFDAVATGLTWADFGATGGAVQFQNATSLANTQAAVRPFTNAATYNDGVYYMAGLMSFDANFSTATTSSAMTGLLNAEEGDPGVGWTLGAQWGFQGNGAGGVDAVFRGRSNSSPYPVVTNVVASNITPGTHLFVVKIDVDYASGSSRDRVTVWLDPAANGIEAILEPTFIDDFANMLDPTTLERTVKNVVFRATDVGDGAVVGYDEVRMAEQWSEVLPNGVPGNTVYLRQDLEGYEHLGAALRGQSSKVDTNYGNVDEMLIGSERDEAGHFRGALAFGTDSIPDNVVITNVELTMTVKRIAIEGNGTGNIELRATDPIVDMIEGDGNAGSGVTWNEIRSGTSWTTGGGDPESTVLASIAQPAAGDTVTFSATPELIAAVQAAVDGDELLELVLMAPDAETNNTYRNFVGLYSDDAANPYQRPLLKISYAPVPEPSTLVLLFGAVGVLLAVRRRVR